MPERSQTGLLVSEMTIRISTPVASPVSADYPERGLKRVYAIAERYLALAANMLSEAKSTLHVAYDPGLVGAHGSSGRYIMPTATNPSAKAAIWEITGRDAARPTPLRSFSGRSFRATAAMTNPWPRSWRWISRPS